MIPAGNSDWPCVLSSSKLSTEDDATVFEGEYASTLQVDSMSLATGMDGTESWSVEALDLRLSPVVLSTVTVTPPFPKGNVEVLQKEIESQHV